MNAVAWSTRQRRKNDVLFALAWLGVHLARLLPRRVLVAAGQAVGLLTWATLGSARRMARANVQRALALPPAEAQRLVRRNFVTLGHALGETLALLTPSARAAGALPIGPGAKETLRGALAGGRGAVLVTAHHGLWEHLAAGLVEEGFGLTTPVRRSYDPRLEALVHAPLRDRRGVVTVDRDAPAAGRALLGALRKGDLVGFLVDLNTRGATAEVAFLGVPAWTTTAPARLARAARVPIVVASAGREGVVVERLSVDLDDVAGTTRAIAAAVSTNILAEPERWIWMHDRFGARR